ncbi:hypothetical protein LVJ94_21410 [Pendulispora rubella]|uniref:Uncharacterized protein n=1 Tax=Pendulispora rubella TaxID=2741070 RepID=A0ABZ2LHC7_9BACT
MASSRGLVAVIAVLTGPLLLACKSVPDLEFDNGRVDGPSSDASFDLPDGRSPADATVYDEDASSGQDAGSRQDAGPRQDAGSGQDASAEEDAGSSEDAGSVEEDAGACGKEGGPSCYCGSRVCVGSGCPQYCNLCAAECENVCCIRVKPNGVPQAKCTKTVDKCKW